MMKKQLFIALLLTAFQPLAAVERTEAEMAAIARQQLLGAGVKGLSGTATQMTCVKRSSSYSIYSPVQGDGFVVVSHDEAVRPVLGYSRTRFRPDNISCGMKWWMEATEAGLQMRKKAPKMENEESMTFEPVAPMMTTKWAQSEPFNNLTPTFDDKHALTGCVATSLSQVLNYNCYPASATFRGYYFDTTPADDYSNAITIDVNSTYSWPLLDAYGNYWPDGYKDQYDWKTIEFSEEQALQVATLMRDCGYAVGMQYSSVGAGSSLRNASVALTSCFSYPQASVEYYNRFYYSNKEWMKMIHDELANGYPVLYSGIDLKTGGHAFIFHGMNEDGLVYVNWGWAGHEDGYYSIDYLPTEIGNFATAQEMIIGIRPQALIGETQHSHFVTDDNYVFSYKSVNHNESAVNVKFNQPFFNLSCNEFNGYIYIVAEDIEDGTVLTSDFFDGLVNVAFSSGYAASERWAKMTFTPNHEYRVYMASQASNEEVPSPFRVPGGAIYYKATVNGDGIPTFDVEPQPLLTNVRALREEPVANGITRVYDIQGHLIHTSPSTTFNQWDIPVHGVFVVKEGNRCRKIVR